ncbi:hypothetical protein P7C70_g4700, partial [Phenoliferia sp. Uapishka_3]
MNAFTTTILATDYVTVPTALAARWTGVIVLCTSTAAWTMTEDCYCTTTIAKRTARSLLFLFNSALGLYVLGIFPAFADLDYGGQNCIARQCAQCACHVDLASRFFLAVILFHVSFGLLYLNRHTLRPISTKNRSRYATIGFAFLLSALVAIFFPSDFIINSAPTIISVGTTLSILFLAVAALEFAHACAEKSLANWEETDTLLWRTTIFTSTSAVLAVKLLLIIFRHTFFAGTPVIWSDRTRRKLSPPNLEQTTKFETFNSRLNTPLRFTCLTIGSRGDVQPYIALCKRLMAEGHSCKIASHEEFRTWVEGHGIGFQAITGDPAELMQLMMGGNFFSFSVFRNAFRLLNKSLPDLLETAYLACRENTDVLIGAPNAVAAYHIAEALRIPYFRPVEFLTLSSHAANVVVCSAFAMPWTRNRELPHPFAVPGTSMGGSYNSLTYSLFDYVLWHLASRHINRWRRETLGLPATSFRTMQRHQSPFLYCYSPTVIPPSPDWQQHIHVNGFWFLDEHHSGATPWEPSPALQQFLDLAKREEKKVVYIGFGSIIVPNAEELTRIVTTAVNEAGVFAVVAKGWSSRGSREWVEGTLDQRNIRGSNEHVHFVPNIPHSWLFPRISAAVHHGGSGTTGASLRAGLPTVVVPFFGDQFLFANRVEELGIGTAVRHLTIEHLTAAIVSAVTDAGQISRAKEVGEAVRKEDGVGHAIKSIYRDLAYARSIIPPRQAERSARSPTLSLPTPSTMSIRPILRVPLISTARQAWKFLTLRVKWKEIWGYVELGKVVLKHRGLSTV